MWYVYLLYCADGTLYCGVTTDVTRRLEEHNAGSRGARYTRSRRPVRLACCATRADRASAQRLEWEVKR
ncbi:GIY-YIG nuclease family protein, partial [uncultured Bilophila sp.]